jgi:hypothetical protein
MRSGNDLERMEKGLPKNDPLLPQKKLFPKKNA